MKNATDFTLFAVFLRQGEYRAIRTNTQGECGQLDAELRKIFSGLVGETGMAVKTFST
ncbi:hypothetical protein [Microbulbifer marinus]|uniref:hypothetical protein n=1 Tax=Microbulbifer marinus TaxID=658218 RepID=UPI00147C1488|nr:hypothetical protein [Microbulbifer marinus]